MTQSRTDVSAGEAAKAVPSDAVVVGRVTAVHGVRGWVKIHSFTDPEPNIFDYQPWWIEMPSGFCAIRVDEFRSTAKGFLAHIVGLDDRDEARLYCQRDILVSASLFPEAGENEVYWHQLQGLRVIASHEGAETDIGVVTDLFETGANDVLVVVGDDNSVDRRERLLPYVDDCIASIDLDEGVLEVNWDPDFV